MKVLKAKVGDTLSWSGARADDNGDPVDLTGATAAASLTGKGGTITPGVSITDAAAGEFEVTASASTTSGWTAGVYVGDVTFTDGLNIQSTETFAITVEREY